MTESSRKQKAFKIIGIFGIIFLAGLFSAWATGYRISDLGNIFPSTEFLGNVDFMGNSLVNATDVNASRTIVDEAIIGTATITEMGRNVDGMGKTMTNITVTDASINESDITIPTGNSFITTDPYIDVRAFGAIPSDGKNDCDAINSAIAYSTQFNISEIRFPEGRFNVTGCTIALYDGEKGRSYTLSGTKQSSLIKSQKNDRGTILYKEDDGVILRINMNSSFHGYPRNANYPHIKDMKFEGAIGSNVTGIKLYVVQNGIFERLTFDELWRGIDAQDSGSMPVLGGDNYPMHTSFRDLQFENYYNLGDTAIYLKRGEANIIQRILIHGNFTYGMYFSQTVSSTVSQATINSCGTAIRTSNIYSMRFSNIHAENSHEYVFYNFNPIGLTIDNFYILQLSNYAHEDPIFFRIGAGKNIDINNGYIGVHNESAIDFNISGNTHSISAKNIYFEDKSTGLTRTARINNGDDVAFGTIGIDTAALSGMDFISVKTNSIPKFVVDEKMNLYTIGNITANKLNGIIDGINTLSLQNATLLLNFDDESISATGKILDSSVFRNDGTFENITRNASYGLGGKGVYFKGDSYINLGSAQSLDYFNTEPFSVIMNIKPADLTTDNLFSKGGNYAALIVNTELQITKRSGGYESTRSGGTCVTAGVWHQVAFVFHGNGNISFYCDGALLSTKVLSGYPFDTTDSHPFYLGRTDTMTGAYIGAMDNVMKFNRIVSADEIKTMYAQQYKPPPPQQYRISDLLTLTARSSAPSSPSEGWIYADSATKGLRYYNSTHWVGISVLPAYVNRTCYNPSCTAYRNATCDVYANSTHTSSVCIGG